MEGSEVKMESRRRWDDLREDVRCVCERVKRKRETGVCDDGWEEWGGCVGVI